MLVLTRRLGEEVVIDGNIRVKIVGIRGHAIRLGFVAPNDVSVIRQELLDRDGQPELSHAHPGGADRTH